MPINNALTPEGQNALGAAFGYYPQLRRNRTLQDPRLAAEMPLQFLRGRVAGTLGLPSDVANLVRSPMPMEMYGDVDYGPQAQVPYGSQELLRTLPLPPQGAAQTAAANVGAVVPLTPMEALQAARAARQAALAGGRALGPTAARMTEGYLQRQGLMPGVLPSPKSLTMPSVPTVEQMKKHGRSEVVPLSQAVSFQSARNWDKFKAGKGPGDLVQGFGDKPLALRLETGEYVIYDGNHRTDLALQQGKTALPMHVIDVKSYDPAHAGRKPVPSKINDDELLNSLFGADTPKFQYPQEEALRLAQQRAALPVEQGGLGLPAGNTAEQRAKAMGFDKEGFHATGSDFRQIDPNRNAQSDYGTIGQGFYIDPSPNAAYSNLVAQINQPKAPQSVMPVMFNSRDLYDLTGTIGPRNAEQSRQLTANIKNAGQSGTYTTMPDGSINEVAVFDPSIVRSRFAAFDPFRRSAAVATAMGVAAPNLLAAEAEDDSYARNELRKFKRQSAR